MKALIEIFVLFSIANIHNVFGQVKYTGSCQQFGSTIKSSFHQVMYMGRWFVHGVYDYDDILGIDCLTVDFIRTAFRKAKIVEREKDLKTKNCSQINSLMTLNDQGTGNYRYEIPGQIDDFQVNILATDYLLYSIEWSCFPDGADCGCYIWILSRFRVPPFWFWCAVNPILKRHNITKKSLRIVKQDKKLCSCQKYT